VKVLESELAYRTSLRTVNYIRAVPQYVQHNSLVRYHGSKFHSAGEAMQIDRSPDLTKYSSLRSVGRCDLIGWRRSTFSSS